MSSLYLHIPFCRSKCPYCDFYSQVGSADQLTDYVDLLSLEIAIQARLHVGAAPLQTIFFGGGTPSLLTAEQVDRLLCKIADEFGIAPDCEISLEANPGTIDEGRLRGYRAAGINRLSLGVQSLCDQQLKRLGRGHTAAEACRSVEMARKTGFDNLNLDLMFARPEQDCDQLTEELQKLLALQPQHVSLYGLSYEKGTEFSDRLQHGELNETDEDEYADQYRLLHRLLTQAGFEHYEISNFSLPGFRCQHNQTYWQRATCFAVGCGAHSFNSSGRGERRAVPQDLGKYQSSLVQQQDPSERIEIFDRQTAMVETIYLALRTSDGLDCGTFTASFGERPEDAFPATFRSLSEHISLCDDRWVLKPESWLLYDHLISHFL